MRSLLTSDTSTSNAHAGFSAHLAPDWPNADNEGHSSRLAAILLRQKARERLAYGWHQITILHLDSDEEYATVALLGYNRINAVERVRIRKANEDYRWGDRKSTRLNSSH